MYESLGTSITWAGCDWKKSTSKTTWIMLETGLKRLRNQCRCLMSLFSESSRVCLAEQSWARSSWVIVWLMGCCELSWIVSEVKLRLGCLQVGCSHGPSSGCCRRLTRRNREGDVIVGGETIVELDVEQIVPPLLDMGVILGIQGFELLHLIG